MLPFLLLLAVEFHQPQLAAAQGKVAMTYGSESTIWLASSTDSGHNFSKPVRIGTLDGLHLGRHRGPRVAILPGAIVISAISNNPGDLVTWRSTDNGAAWSRGGTINDVKGAAKEGLHAMVADSKGNLFAAWLDLRGKGTRLYGSRSTDGGVTWQKNTLIYASPEGTICQCCDPSIAFDDRGQVWVMWRNALDGSRDLYLAHSSDGVQFSPAQKLGEGTWKLDACPMDGGAIAFDHGQPVSAWRRGNNVFLDQPGQPETLQGAGKDVTMAVGSRGPYVMWSNAEGIELRAPGAASTRKIAAGGAFPNMVSLPDGAVLAAWEDKGAIRTERLQ